MAQIRLIYLSPNLPIAQSANRPIGYKTKPIGQARQFTNQPIYLSADQKTISRSTNQPIYQSNTKQNQSDKQNKKFTYRILDKSLIHLFVWQFFLLLDTLF